MNEQGSKKIRVKVRKADSAFLTFIIDASDGIATHTTLPHAIGDPHRELDILFSADFEAEAKALLGDLSEIVEIILESS